MSQAPQIHEKKVSAARNIAVSFSGKLDVGELLTGTPTIVEVTTTDLTLSDKVVSTAILTINGVSVPINEAVQFHVEAGGTAGTQYKILITVGTDSTPAQTLVGVVLVDVVADS